MLLVIPIDVLTSILKKAKEVDYEICGFIFGKREGNKFIGKRARFIENTLRSPIRFKMNPEEMLKALEEAEKLGEEPVSIFHSHVNCPPYPSEEDLKGMRNWRIPWLIVNRKGEFSAYILEGDEIKKVEVELRYPNRTPPSRA
ncbi:M67 family metallopeptidase [Pyrococcus abyssi]|uniref:Transcription regulator protein, putative, Mov34/MPN/PAD-1 family n=1 Tax=Pyrococcus abyssi (strain GE5 / Orsay) TaxID=272844 RepID=Q9V0W1_PYRAB|nr:M67 family metallopeptidase [Pyrococcus abyssi]CAB49592.1 Transcription regulator protein, putative, Mov34/MPN/PAD-1 family [Pyrococcus abyssi GE5]CCE70065.1 TPA: hypothetical protein PAB1919 [Pyrococcus abyssi GE5]